MTKFYNVFRGMRLALLITALLIVQRSNAQITQTTFLYTGSTQSFVVPPCVSTLSLDVKGAAGANSNDKLVGNSTGGLGGRSQGILAVSPGQVLFVTVGGAGNTNGNGGFNGGGAGGVSTAASGSLACFGGPAGGGGGASDIRVGGIALSNRIIVAGGGGGAGRDYCYFFCLPCGCGGSGGAGGGLVGVNGQPANTCNGGSYNGASVNFGVGGSGSIGGAGGPQDPGTGANAGTAGALGTGGAGAPGQNDVAGGGGGGGYYGGGGGGGALNGNSVGGGGGGGGSSYFSGLTSTTTTQAFQSGNGVITIAYEPGIPLTGAIASPSSICVGASSTLSASGQAGYTWTPGGTNSNSVVVSPTVTTTYSIAAISALGCPSSTLLTVTVYTAVPSLTVTASATDICAGKTVTFTATGADTYTWTNGIVNGAGYSPATTSTYMVTGENGCGTGTAAISVTVNLTPNITASVSTPTLCSGTQVTFNGGGSTTGYIWSNGVLNNVAYAPAVTGNYTVTGGSANGCTNTAVVGVTVLLTPTLAPIATPTAICAGNSATLSGGGATGFTWTPGNALNTQSIVVSPPISTTYTLFRSNGPCSGTSTVNLVVNPLPPINATASTTLICSGNSSSLSASGALSYTWSPGTFTTANTVVYPDASKNYTVIGSNGNCTATAVVSISVNPSPTISITASTLTICQGNSALLTGSGDPGLIYNWQPLGSGNPVVIVNPVITTTYTLTALNTLGCTSIKTITINVNPVPLLNLATNVPFVCAGQSATISVSNPSANISYSWSTGISGSVAVTSPSTTTIYTVTGSNMLTGCQNTNTISIIAYNPAFVVSGTTTICAGQSASLSANGAANSFSWSANGGIISPNVVVTPSVSTTYSVTGINGNCFSSATVPVTVYPLPNVTATTAKSQICRFEVSTITGSGASTYSWNTGATMPVISFTLSTTTTYTLTGTDLNGCSKTVTVTQYVATCIGVNELQTNGKNLISVYPNPNSGNFSIHGEANMTLRIINSLGQLVSVIDLTQANKNTAVVSGLEEGVYFLTGESAGTKLYKRIVIER